MDFFVPVNNVPQFLTASIGILSVQKNNHGSDNCAAFVNLQFLTNGAKMGGPAVDLNPFY